MIEDEKRWPFWTIGRGESEYLKMVLLSRPTDKTVEGYDWIDALVEIKAGGFFGKANINLTLSDIITFQKDIEGLYRDLSGTAQFKTIENQVGFTVEAARGGQMTFVGFVKDDVSFGNKLTFEMELDQTFLKRTISEVDKAILAVKNENYD